MNRYYKTLSSVMLIALAMRLVAFCCCMEETQASGPAAHAHHDHGAKSHGDHADHGQADGSNPSHDHSQCDHEELLGELTNCKPVDLFKKFVGMFKFQQKHVLPHAHIDAFSSGLRTPLPLGASPPYGKLAPNSLYLDISVLRI